MRQNLRTAHSVSIAIIILLSIISVAHAVNPYINALDSPTITASQYKLDQGQIAILNSTAETTGTPPYSYQWLAEPPNSTNFVPINGATSESYRFDSTGAALGNWSIKLQTTDNTSTTVDSNVVSITVYSPMAAPIIQVNSNSNYTQLDSGSVQINRGDWVNISVNLYNGGGEPPFTYLWLMKPPGNIIFSAISGAKSDSYNFQTTAYTSLGNYSFELEIIDKAGSIALSNVVTVTIKAPAPAPTPIPTPVPTQTLSNWPSLLDNITLNAWASGMAYDSGKGEIFFSSGPVSIMSDTNNTFVATIAGPSGGGGICYDSGKGEIFVANFYGNTVSVISDSSNTVIANVTVGNPPLPGWWNTPRGVAYDSAKGEIFVAVASENAVSVISDSTNTVIATIQVGSLPTAIAYDPNNGEIYVTNENDSTISVISDNNNNVIATIPVGHGIGGLTCDYGKGEVFVTNPGGNTVSVISDKTNTVVSTIPVGLNPSGIAYDSGKGEIYVANGGAGNPFMSSVSDTFISSVSVIPDNNDSVISNVAGGQGAMDVCYDSGRNEIFVTTTFGGFASPVSYYSFSTVLVFSDSSPLTAPLVSFSSGMVTQGQTAVLTSELQSGVSPYKYQ